MNYKKSIVIILICLNTFVTIGCTSDIKKREELKKKAIDEYILSLSDAAKISQLFLVNIEGNENFTPVEKTRDVFNDSFDDTPLLSGGCLFFSYNIADSKEKIKSFTRAIKKFYIHNGYPPPYLAIDQEGGYVNRLRGITQPFPSSKYIAQNMSVEQAKILYTNQAEEIGELGFNLNLAPVVEVETNDNADFLDTRSFGSIEEVLTYAPLEINAFESNRIGTVLKHFPGNTNTDPHTGLPELNVDCRQLENELIAPFKELLPLSSGVLMSHARISVYGEKSSQYSFAGNESQIPSCLSYFWVTKVIREKFKFNGLIFSDDIFMGALADNGFPPDVACIRAIESGIDVIMLSEKKFGDVAKIIFEKSKQSPDFNQKIHESLRRVIEFKIKAGLLDLIEITSDMSGKKLKEPYYFVTVSEV